VIRKFERDLAAADVAAVDELLGKLSNRSILGRRGLEERRRELTERLAQLEQHPGKQASVALYFSGDPVVGAVGIEGEFAGRAISKYQDVVSKVMAVREVGNLAARGVVPGRREAALHITNTLHGSFGFLLRELRDQEPLLDTPLKAAVDDTNRLMASLAADDDEKFAEALDSTDKRVFTTVGEFFQLLRDSTASIRIVAGDADRRFDPDVVARAAERARATQMDDFETEIVGELRGVLPQAHRFEFYIHDDGTTVQGAVSSEISTELLRELYRQLADRRSRARVRIKQITRPGKEPRKSYTLLAVAADG
jgi:hypothetical protein